MFHGEVYELCLHIFSSTSYTLLVVDSGYFSQPAVQVSEE